MNKPCKGCYMSSPSLNFHILCSMITAHKPVSFRGLIPTFDIEANLQHKTKPTRNMQINPRNHTPYITPSPQPNHTLGYLYILQHNPP